MKEMARSERLKEQLGKEVAGFLSSVQFDWRLLPYDVQGSLAHVQMLEKCQIITSPVSQKIQDGLKQILNEWETHHLSANPEWEDVHMNVEGRLHEIIGEDAGYLHTARSRNDQVATDMHLYLRAEGEKIADQLVLVVERLLQLSERTRDVIMPGYTHMQTAQPIVMGHHWLAYAWMYTRDCDRVHDWAIRAHKSPLGAGALSGTSYATDPQFAAQLLEFESLYDNSIDAVSDRDFLLEFLSFSSLLMVHVSRMAEELVLWSTQEFDYIRIGDSHSTGSSIMPQKKNPDVAELMRGKSGRVFGHLTGLLTMMKGLPLAYNSDMQEDKEAIFDTVDTVNHVLAIIPGLLNSLDINRDRLYQQASKHFIEATDLADRLTRERKLPFREAHHRVGQIVTHLLEAGCDRFNQVSPELWGKIAPDIPYDWLSALSPEALILVRSQSFGTSPVAIDNQIIRLQDWLTINQGRHHAGHQAPAYGATLFHGNAVT